MVPGRPGCGTPLPRGGHRDRRLLAHPGFIDDTRGYCSIPARHDVSRRLDSGYLAQLVAEHRIDEDEGLDTASFVTTMVGRITARTTDADREAVSGATGPANVAAEALARGRRGCGRAAGWGAV